MPIISKVCMHIIYRYVCTLYIKCIVCTLYIKVLYAHYIKGPYAQLVRIYIHTTLVYKHTYHRFGVPFRIYKVILEIMIVKNPDECTRLVYYFLCPVKK
jgi:hypothetical protein